MSKSEEKDEGSTLMKVVSAIAITPDDARQIISNYDTQIRKASPQLPDALVLDQVLDDVVSRYATMAAGIGGATSLAGVVPGIGTAVAMSAGGITDVAACVKLQADMTMCLAVAICPELSNEDAKHLTMLIALTCTLEEAAEKGAKRITTEALARLVNKHLQGATLVALKELFKQVGLQFSKKALLKVIPFGVGVVVGATANYWLTKFVGKSAIAVLRSRAGQQPSEMPQAA